LTVTEAVKNKVLEAAFVTSATDPIYALRHNVPPEVFGAFGSYFSRNPEDLRNHLWKAITGQLEEETTDVAEGMLDWLASVNDPSRVQELINRTIEEELKTRLGSRLDAEELGPLAHALGGALPILGEPSEALRKGIAKSQDFFRRWYGKYSHKSIANTVWLPMVGTNVTQMFARELAYDQLAFFIEQSTRYVRWGLSNMFQDPSVMVSPHKDAYLNTLTTMAENYDRFATGAVEFYQGKIPFDQWLTWQKEAVQKGPERERAAKYKREIQGAALDVARFLLPQACQTNIAWIVDARSTEFDIAAWKGHPLQEIRTAANLIERNAGMLAPSLLKYTDENPYFADKLRGYDGDLHGEPAQPITKGVDVISYEADSLDRVVAHLLLKSHSGGSFGQRLGEARRMSFDDKRNILERVTRGRERTDEWVGMDEEFNSVRLSLEIRTDLGAVRDWRRHQKWDRTEPRYTLDNGIHRPAVIDEMSAEMARLFDDTIHTAYDAEKRIRSDFPFEAQYVLPMATMQPIVMTSGLDQAQYMIWTRTTPEGNFSYRQDAFAAAEAVVRTHPWMLGYERYPEGRTFMEVYEERPLKGILRLQTAETALHT